MKGRLVATTEIGDRGRDAMFDLFSEFFRGVSKERFFADLEHKDWAVTVTDSEGGLRGFSTFARYQTSAAGRPLQVLVSGDTVVDPSARRSNMLARTVLGAIMTLGGCAEVPLLWLLICSSFRTYRFLPVFLREFYPRFDLDTPPSVQELIRLLAHERWGRYFDPSSGLVVFDEPQILRQPETAVAEARRTDPNVGFFLRSNPGWLAGDELVCLAELSPENLNARGRRILRSVAPEIEFVGGRWAC